MKFQYLFLLISFFIFSTQLNAQGRVKYYEIKTSDGTMHVGKLISDDKNEVVLETEKLGEISIPKYQVSSMKEVKKNKDGSLPTPIQDNEFPTRYFYTTNGFSIPKGDVHASYSFLGPDFQIGITDRITAGLLTTWLASPIVGSVKYTIPHGDKLNFAVGTLLGSLSWISVNSGGILPFGAMTYGTKEKNINVSLGYGAVWTSGDVSGNLLFSIGGAFGNSKSRASFVFDSMLFPSLGNTDFGTNGVLIPGIKLKSRKKPRAFQFGFGIIVSDSTLVPTPFPFLRWLRKY